MLFTLSILGDQTSAVGKTLRRLARLSAACALLFGLGWLIAEAAAIADANSLATALAASPVVAFRTQYGRWFVLRCVLLAAVLLLPLGRRAGLLAALVLAGATVGVQPMLGHAGAMGGSIGAELIVSELLHLLAASAWLGGLLPLFIVVNVLPDDAAVSACRNFTSIGLASVLLLAGTAVVQVTTLMGGLPGLLGTAYGHLALVKLGLFLVLLFLAALNRLVFTERLADSTSHAARRHMRISIAVEVLLGIAVIFIAGFLASLTPGTHEQPVWPLPWQPSLFALSDPLLRGQLLAALTATGTACAAVVIGLIWRRIRWYAFAVAVLLLVLAIPRLGPLFVDAYPTSFFTSPTEFAATAIARGARLFAADCAGCHGTEGRGDGAQAAALPVMPADLMALHFQAHSDGDLYWFIGHGFTMRDGTTAMPGFANKLSSEAIWDLIDFLRAHYAGTAMRQLGTWPEPVAMPQFDAQCSGGQSIDLDDLRGRAVRVITLNGRSPAEAVTPSTAAATVLVALNKAPEPGDNICVTTERELWTALAIILGVSPDNLAGAQFLVDQNGWLRTAWRPGEGGGWGDASVLAARVHDILTHPLTVSVPSGHPH